MGGLTGEFLLRNFGSVEPESLRRQLLDQPSLKSGKAAGAGSPGSRL
jgi:hypothetical protein